MRELLELLTDHNEAVPLDVATLQLATIEHPEVSVEPFLALMDSYASELGERICEATDGEEFLTEMNDYLIDELGFAGNHDDYYNPANSCLNEVLTKRLGIPITLSVLYMEIGRRLGRTFHGIGLPGHFIVHYEESDFTAYVDPFNAGRLLDEDECYALAKEVTGYDVSHDPSVLLPVSKRHIILRMLNNLRAVYYRRQNPAKAHEVLSLLIAADPGAPEEYKQRAICRTQLKMFQAAKGDFETYLKLAADGPEKEEVASQLQRLKKWMAKLN